MKSLILILCVALTASAEVPVTSITEQMKTIATLLQEHHHRFTRQVTTPPPNRSEPSPCLLASQSALQRCFVDHGVDIADVDPISNPYNPFDVFVILSDYCGDDDCQKALLNFYVECLGGGGGGGELVASAMNASFRAFCQMNDNGSFCYEVFFNSVPDVHDVANATNIASCFFGNCTEECIEGLTAWASFGCCTTEYFRSFEVGNINTANLLKGAWGICGFEIPGYCNGTRTQTIEPPTSPTPAGTPATGTPTAPPTNATSTISTTSTTPTPTTFPPIPRNSKCARQSRALSADQTCSGGANVGEILSNRSALLDTARISQLHSHFCSSQKCFKKYVTTYSACQVQLRGADGNATAGKEVVREVFNVLVPYTRKLYCAEKDGQFCAIRFPEILSPNFSSIVRVCATTPPKAKCSKDCCDAVGHAAEKYGCCFREFWDLLPPLRLPCLSGRVWRKCRIPKPPRCQYVLRKPRKPRS